MVNSERSSQVSLESYHCYTTSSTLRGCSRGLLLQELLAVCFAMLWHLPSRSHKRQSRCIGFFLSFLVFRVRAGSINLKGVAYFPNAGNLFSQKEAATTFSLSLWPNEPTTEVEFLYASVSMFFIYFFVFWLLYFLYLRGGALAETLFNGLPLRGRYFMNHRFWVESIDFNRIYA